MKRLIDPRALAHALAPLLWIALGVGLGRLSAPLVHEGNQAAHAHGKAVHGETVAEVWTCSMDPQVRAPAPGRCPICGMDLIPASSLKGGALAPDTLRLDEAAARLAQIRTSLVEPIPLEDAPAPLLGRVEVDEGRLRVVTAWIGGRVEALRVATTGARVKRGQALAQLYSPEIYTAHQDLLAALGQRRALRGAAGVVAEAQLEAARQRLRLLGLPSGDLKRMEADDAPWTRVSIRSAEAGTVLTRRISQGDYVKPGQVLYEIADLSRVWINLDAYEVDLAHARLGQRASLTVEALPERAFEGEITFIDPVLDPKTRVARLRVAVDNHDGALKPGMYASARLSNDHEAGPPPLTIPATAPLFAGRRVIVYVERAREDAARVYQARLVKLGARRLSAEGDRYPVLAGLTRGERVVTHGAFTLDADLQLRGGLSLMSQADDGAPSALDEVLSLERAALARLTPVVDGYLDVQEMLANSDLKAALARAAAWHEALDGVSLGVTAPAAQIAWDQLRAQLLADINALNGAADLAHARLAFGRLTREMDALFLKFGNPVQVPVRLAYCPMAFDSAGGAWYQRAAEIDNVYYGDQMRRCGEIRAEIAPGAHQLPLEAPR
ncbi:efflux RND transporter periplasmic adaptor subunit [Myxococcota bacterium]|nr:efflux RND transporter periplasmic adaptor subunit [Myxococcota bacterium]